MLYNKIIIYIAIPETFFMNLLSEKSVDVNGCTVKVNPSSLQSYNFLEDSSKHSRESRSSRTIHKKIKIKKKIIYYILYI